MMTIGSDVQSLAELRCKPVLLGNRAIFTPYERAYCESRRDPWASLGGILCAKESCVKALSAFDPPRFTFHDLEIRHRHDGRPAIRPGTRLAPWLETAGIGIQITISHSGDYAMATALAAPNSLLT